MLNFNTCDNISYKKPYYENIYQSNAKDKPILIGRHLDNLTIFPDFCKLDVFYGVRDIRSSNDLNLIELYSHLVAMVAACSSPKSTSFRVMTRT